MTALNRTTRRRLQSLRQIPSVWEGDRRPLSANLAALGELTESHATAVKTEADCILWADGSEGVVRAMEMVPPETGSEAVVRTLLRAMEHPQGPGKPCRPQKIVVRDRQLQFFLRGVLQDLDIVVDCVPHLPLIDEIFRSFQDVVNSRPPKTPPAYTEALTQIAFQIWQDAPWNLLADHQILAVELNHGDLETLYVSVMGMLGMEYGLLFYRSQDSLERFRASVLQEEGSPETLEEAFLAQDCLFLTFDSADEDLDGEEVDLAGLPVAEIEPAFGNLHPLEGMRPFIYEEEAIALLVCLEALHRFLHQHRRKFSADDDLVPALSSRYRIPNPEDQGATAIAVKVGTLPDLTAKLLEMMDQTDDEGEDIQPLLRDDLVPHDAFFSIGAMPWESLSMLRETTDVHQAAPRSFPEEGDGFPVILIQTSRPKAKNLIAELQKAGGLKAICFNPGEDPFEGNRYDLGILQTESGDLHLFGEFVEDDPVHTEARKKWDRRCKQTQGFCGLVIAKGITGVSRGKPQLRDMVALFEVRLLSSKELGLGTLQLIPQLG
ncbi:hypothetical protein DO97_09110 [Neosynechococcus sphagnicola sy1]|uniref:Uncharacterized protein n=1 Tax=Neosynechococcus sphagnicola sy1 TaxID=1497020 RepID=A0A098TJJ2_9CYAN|nr:hypothetical protein [Neosynechococcus sphagnicola]KGF72399.1 hypothetical protein DO97_09110 [Neosynechococcus sphagnicola sy1]